VQNYFGLKIPVWERYAKVSGLYSIWSYRNAKVQSALKVLRTVSSDRLV